MKLSVLIKTIKGVTGKAIIIFVRQMLAILVTLLFALGGGALTGLLMMCVARIQVAFAVYFNIKNKLGSLDRSQSLFFYAPQKKNMNITAKLARLGITKINPAGARSARVRRACALRALGLLLADRKIF